MKRLLHAPVRTVAGRILGKIQNVTLDAETGKLVYLHVRARGVVPHLLDDELLVTWSQIISLSEEEVVVNDATVMTYSSVLAESLSHPST